MPSMTRRVALKLLGMGATVLGVGRTARSDDSVRAMLDAAKPVGNWSNTHDRIFLGGEFWANPMEDWRIVDGAAECRSTGGNRNIQLLTHQLADAGQPLVMRVDVKQVELKRVDGGAGFRIGIRSDIDEYRSNCFARGGLDAGVIDGKLVLGRQSKALDGAATPNEYSLELTGRPEGARYSLTLTARSADGELLGTITHEVDPQAVRGNVAVVNNFDADIKKGQGARYRFANWAVGGDAFEVHDERRFGPILWSMYSLSDSRSDEGYVLKLSALTGPLGEADNKTVELQTSDGANWTTIATAELDREASVATFRIPKWDETQRVQYRLMYRESHRDGSSTDSYWTGTIRENPAGRALRMAALTCQKDYAFPYEPVADNLRRLDPDLLYFSGDQIYEDHGGFGLIREPAEPAILNYLRKFYMFGWSFREAMRDRPTLCLPDDHDVFQGNLWGEAGAAMSDDSTSSNGGYREPAPMVNVVHKTCAGHHPDYYDPEPCKQGISVYFGDMVYGGVGFAIVADRQFKSGPEHVETGEGRTDHVEDADFDASQLDKPGLELLGRRQEEFLKQWADDWRGHEMKVLLSQTVFAGVATHHGRYDGYLKADLDCGGWPQTPRNRAVGLLRRAMALHVNGDQHLTTLVQYGVDRQRDGNWSFCPPAIAVGYPRWWRPDELDLPHENRPSHGLDNTGEFLDGLGNRVYVYAVGNPEVATKRNRYERAHQKGSGFGMVTIDTAKKTYTIEAFRFLVDATDGKVDGQFPGWPVTLYQKENRGENVVG